MDSFFYLVMLAGAIAGAGAGLLGVYIVGMRAPFIGVCISHTAMAGMIYSILFGINQVWWPALFSMLCAMSLAAIRPGRSRIDVNVALAILFNLVLGASFLGVGLMQGTRTEVLGLLWGSLLFVRRGNVLTISVLTLVFVIFAAIFNKELKAMLFSRTMASATGVHESLVYALLLGLCGLVLSASLPLVGGLMMFSLTTCPAAAAYQVCRGHRAVVVMATFFGSASAILGFLASYWLDLPTGACIVITSTIIFGLCVVWRLCRDQ